MLFAGRHRPASGSRGSSWGRNYRALTQQQVLTIRNVTALLEKWAGRGLVAWHPSLESLNSKTAALRGLQVLLVAGELANSPNPLFLGVIFSHPHLLGTVAAGQSTVDLDFISNFFSPSESHTMDHINYTDVADDDERQR